MEKHYQNLSGAVLVIGSLFWENDFKSEAGLRQKWRAENFKMNAKKITSAPIIYGRKSSTRFDTFTMIFSNRYFFEKPGKAYLLPIKDNSFERAIEEQSLRLAYVEGILPERILDQIPTESQVQTNYDKIKEGLAERIRGESALSAVWGKVAFMANPNLKGNFDGYNYIKDFWFQFGRSLSFFDATYSSKLISTNDLPVDLDNGYLNIPWTTEMDQFAYVLTAVTYPNIKKYPTSNEIAEAMNGSGYFSYFINNLKNGIVTWQDEEIKKQLNYKF